MTGAPLASSARRAWALAGVTAGAVGMAVATVAAYLLVVAGWGSAAASPLVAVGSAFVDATPAWLKTWAVGVFGTADKLALAMAMAVVLGLLFAGLGVLGRARPGAARAGVVVLGGIGLAAVLTRPEAGTVEAAPTLLGGGASLWWLTDAGARLRRGRGARPEAAGDGNRPSLRVRAGVGEPSGDPAWLGEAETRRAGQTGAELSRRDLIGTGLAVGVSAVAASATAAPAQGRGPTTVALPTLPTPTGAPVTAADLGVPGASPWQVPSALFYRIDTALAPPRLRAGDWSIRVWGEVEREVTLTWEQLLAKPLQQHWVTLACVSNEVGGDLVGNALWGGWPVRELLALAGPRPGADMVLSRSADGWTAGTPLAALTDDRAALLAVSMNGMPLPVEHGFPVRLVVPGLYGYVSATKWVVELKVTRFAVDQGYWTPRGWSALGPVKLASRIEVPRSGARVAAGRVAVAGTAWAMHRGIEAVQVRVDDGPWQDARLAAEPTVDSWRQWVYEWDAVPGPHTLTVRARSRDGEWQTEATAAVAPDGATGHHTVAVQVG